jgi:hypothetical protein
VRQHIARHGVTAKHSSSKHAAHHQGKHPASTQKHTAKAAHKAPPPAAGMNPLPGKARKPRRLTPDGAVGLCSARAVAESLRLALGIRASDDDVLDLYFRVTPDPDEGASILATLHAAATFGLAGARPCFEEVMPLDRWRSRIQPDDVLRGPEPLVTGLAGLILGTELPGPHAVTVAPDGCWLSWGEHYDPAAFPDAVVEEAWSVRWAA